MRSNSLVGWLAGAAICVVATACHEGDGGAAVDGARDGGTGDGGTGDGGTGDGGAGDGGTGDGGTGDGGASPIEPIDLSTFCARLAAQGHDYLLECFGFSGERMAYIERAVSRCEAAASGVAAGRLAYDGAAAARCVAESRAEGCFTRVSTACDDALVGLVEPGGECYSGESSFTCRDGACVTTDNVCPGTCVALPEIGAPCLDGAGCGPGAVCLQNGRCGLLPAPGEACASGMCAPGATCVVDTCRRLATHGEEPCDDETVCPFPVTICVRDRCRTRVDFGEPCQLPLHCPAGSICRDRTCRAAAVEGEACVADRECVSGLHCAFTEPRTCVPFAEIGAPCQPIPCTPGASCVFDEATGANRCRARVGLDESCADSFDLCAEGLYCTDARVCRPPGARGESCWAVRPCEEGLGCHCAAQRVDACETSQQDDGDTCQPLVSDGGPCFTFTECASLYCDLGGSESPTEAGRCAPFSPACLP